MKANKAFYFAYPNGFSDVKSNTEMIEVDFRKHEGHGICFRNNVDFLYCGEKKLYVSINTTTDITLKVEFKTEASGGCADTSQNLLLSTGESEHIIDIPETFSAIREICFAALRGDNEGLDTSEYCVSDFEIR